MTKYRTEMRCCTTQYRNVFDHQETLDVVLQFPQGSELEAGESESFRVSLIGDEAHLDVDFQVLSTLSNYQVANKVIQGHIATLTLQEIPVVINPSEIGENSVSNVRLKIMEDNSGVVVFTDIGQKGRLVTGYDIVVKDGFGRAVDTDHAVFQGRPDHRIILTNKLSLSSDHTLELHVSRSGAGLSQPVSFVKTFFRPH